MDRFGFEPYVDAVSQFLSNKDTKPPLTVSIEGEWGSGKSSFMLQLIEKLKQRLPRAKTKFIWFSPWRHDKQESMWAAFALEFSRQLTLELSLADRLRICWQLKQARFDWTTGAWDVLRAIGLLVAWITCIAALVILMMAGVNVLDLKQNLDDVFEIAFPAVGGLVGLGAIAFTFKRIAGAIGNPFRFNIERHLRQPDYAARVTFLERFNDDFGRIVAAYAPKAKVFVFIDDLDRCEVPKAADLMQAINLLIGSSTQLIFILGMDRSKVAAGLAVKHKSLIPFLRAESASDSPSAISEQRDGLDFGYAFIEKFVQVAFRLPAPTNRDIEHFLDHLDDSDSATTPPDATAADESEDNSDAGVVEHDWNQFTLKVDKDSDTVREVTKMVAPALDNNPRRIIQFINTFRLKAFVAHRTGLFNLVRTTDGTHVSPLTFWQLGKFVAIGLKWPTLLLDLDARRSLLVELEEAVRSSTSGPDPTVRRWMEDQQLKDLITFRTGGTQGHAAESYSLAQLNVDVLLAVSPAVERPHEPQPASSPQSGVKSKAPAARRPAVSTKKTTPKKNPRSVPSKRASKKSAKTTATKTKVTAKKTTSKKAKKLK